MRQRWIRWAPGAVAAALVLSACAGAGEDDRTGVTDSPTSAPGGGAERAPGFRYPPAPASPAAEVDDGPAVRDAMQRITRLLEAGTIDDMPVWVVSGRWVPQHLAAILPDRGEAAQRPPA